MDVEKDSPTDGIDDARSLDRGLAMRCDPAGLRGSEERTELVELEGLR